MATDYLIIGGGTAGCVVATRLKEYQPAASVTILEAGPNEHAHEWITEPMGTFQLHMSPFEYNYRTVPQKQYHGREVFNAGGKLLSGSSCVNYAMWTRGGKSDYDVWADLVSDNRWSYAGLLPYFRKTETHHDPQNVDQAQHGFDGPIYTTASARPYPLHNLMKQSFLNTGLKWNPDANGGDPLGVAAYTENWRDGKRQPAGLAYGLKGVDVRTSSTVRKIIIEDGVAKGAELTDRSKVMANKEVILSCGALRSPQILLLSGIGPRDELTKHNIPQLVDLPDVGRNLNDHVSLAQFYKVRHPEQGVAAGHPNWNKPEYLLGVPGSVVITATAPKDKLKAALIQDGEQNVTDDHPMLKPGRGHIEVLPLYAAAESPLTNVNVPFDGNYIMTAALNLLPTSRGSITLASTDPAADPLIDPNYFATETDRVIMREGLRLAMRAMESKEGREMHEGEFLAPDFTPLTSKSSDADLDARVKRAAATYFHPTGTCAMGKVVDTELRVKGVKGLRVVDASVMPCPIGAHYQVATYAIGEQGAVMIAGEK